MSLYKFFIIFIIVLFTYFGAITVIAAQPEAKTTVPIVAYNPKTVQKTMIIKMIDQYNPKLSTEQKETISIHIIKNAEGNGFDPFLLASVIAAESSFRPKAVSHCQARGLMQLTGSVLSMMKVSDPYNIEQNIAAGTRYLKLLGKRFYRQDLVLAAYNAGPTRVARLMRIPKITETRNYVRKIMRTQLSLRENFRATLQCMFINPVVYPSLTGSAEPLLASSFYRESSPRTTPNHLDICDQRRSWIFAVA